MTLPDARDSAPSLVSGWRDVEDGTTGSGKLGERVASMLEDRIVSAGWPVGSVIGSEPELLAEYGISRAVFREAVRLLEHHSIAKMRRGPGGGLVVTVPDTSSVVRAATLHLRYDGATPQDVFEARSALELKIVEMATETINEEGIDLLRETLRREAEIQAAGHHLGTHDIHLAIAQLTGNPAMRLFLEVLTELTQPPRRPADAASEKRRRDDVRHAHERIVEAIVAGDGALARRRMHVHLVAIGQFLQQGSPASSPPQARNAVTPEE
jgi:DNA-binding FadR family transcriptional regulator